MDDGERQSRFSKVQQLKCLHVCVCTKKYEEMVLLCSRVLCAPMRSAFYTKQFRGIKRPFSDLHRCFYVNRPLLGRTGTVARAAAV